MSDKDQDRIRVLRGIMIQSGAELPKAVLNLAKADNLNHKRKIKTTKIEREELSTKMPKRELQASETVSLVTKNHYSSKILGCKHFSQNSICTFSRKRRKSTLAEKQ